MEDKLGVELRPSIYFACPCQEELLSVYRLHLRHCLVKTPSPEEDITPPTNFPAEQTSTAGSGHGDRATDIDPAHGDRAFDIDPAPLSVVNAVSAPPSSLLSSVVNAASSPLLSQTEQSQVEQEILCIESDESASSDSSLESGDDGNAVYFCRSYVQDIPYT